ncbi:MAG TPA: 2-oxoacid:acceptor oxidoreductase family protein [Gaiellaceae bacterium]|jgi:pyruvate ferredoxin oxidoreductase gamma subunit|nr:2-oxoacid:acceptor oxidoreductase family protein [Gaiellaceae bacterium]
MPELTEIRWHARAGQGAKTAAQALALALLRSGRSVQAFPEYGPERRGAPLRAYTRFAAEPIRRHDAVEEPDVIVVLDPTLADEPAVRDGARPDTSVLVSPAAGPSANLRMLGAVAAELGEPPLPELERAVVELLGGKAPADELRAAVAEGYRCRS